MKTDLEYGRLYRKEQKRVRQNLGLCRRCGHESAIDGKTLGVECKKKSDEQSRRRWASEKEKLRESYRKRRRRRAILGLCLECGKSPVLTGRTLCAECRGKNIARWQQQKPVCVIHSSPDVLVSAQALPR